MLSAGLVNTAIQSWNERQGTASTYYSEHKDGDAFDFLWVCVVLIHLTLLRIDATPLLLQ